jgi:hypothetical protein
MANRRESQSFSILAARSERPADPETFNVVNAFTWRAPCAGLELKPLGTELALKDCRIPPKSAVAAGATVPLVPGAI